MRLTAGEKAATSAKRFSNVSISAAVVRSGLQPFFDRLHMPQKVVSSIVLCFDVLPQCLRYLFRPGFGAAPFASRPAMLACPEVAPTSTPTCLSCCLRIASAERTTSSARGSLSFRAAINASCPTLAKHRDGQANVEDNERPLLRESQRLRLGYVFQFITQPLFSYTARNNGDSLRHEAPA